jgi:multiple sugar transport system substrate-binding protein
MNRHNFPRLSPFSQAILTLSLVFAIICFAPLARVQSQEATAEPLDMGNLSPDVPTPTEPVTVTFASWVGTGDVWQQLGTQFHELYPNITIEFQDVPAEEMRTKLLTQVAANNPPDVAFMDGGTVGEFASRGALVNLDSYIEKSTAVVQEDYIPAFLNATIYEDSIYGLPIDAETTGLFYRTDLFEEAGIDHPPATWEEFRATAEALTDPEKRQYGFILFAPESAYYWYPFLWQAGGDLLTPEGEIMFNNEDAKRAAEFYVGLRDFTPPDFWNSNSWDGRVAFAQGTVGMYIAGGWFAGTLLNEFPDITGKWATAPLPADQRCATTIAGDSLVIFKASQNQDAAWKWIEFVSAPENMALINLGTEDAPGTTLPPRQSILDDPDTFANNSFVEGFAGNMNCAVQSSNLPPVWPEVEQAINDQLARAIYGEVDASTALDEAALEAEDIIANQ